MHNGPVWANFPPLIFNVITFSLCMAVDFGSIKINRIVPISSMVVLWGIVLDIVFICTKLIDMIRKLDTLETLLLYCWRMNTYSPSSSSSFFFIRLHIRAQETDGGQEDSKGSFFHVEEQ